MPFEYNFCMKFLTNPNSKKKKLAILCIAAVEKPKNLISKFQFHFFSVKDKSFLIRVFLIKTRALKAHGCKSNWYIKTVIDFLKVLRLLSKAAFFDEAT